MWQSRVFGTNYGIIYNQHVTKQRMLHPWLTVRSSQCSEEDMPNKRTRPSLYSMICLLGKQSYIAIQQIGYQEFFTNYQGLHGASSFMATSCHLQKL